MFWLLWLQPFGFLQLSFLKAMSVSVVSCARYFFSLLFAVLFLAASGSLLLRHRKCTEGHGKTGLCPLLGPLWLKHVRVKKQSDNQTSTFIRPGLLQPKKTPRLCNMFGPRTLQWGWAEACKHTKGGDETCELFMESEMFHDERLFLEIADRASPRYRKVSARDDPYFPQLGRLKQRLVEATLEERPLSILVLGPSTTFGRGCPVKQLRWTDALQNLSNFRESPLSLSVFNEGRPGTTLPTEWQYVISRYMRNESMGVDLIVLDYSATARANDKTQGDAVVVLHTFIQGWTRPPAILFLANFHTGKTPKKPCKYAQEFETEEAFYGVAKQLQIPMLSYPDIACHLPSLNRTSMSTGGAAFYHAYNDYFPKISPTHFGCGVHFILAHAVHLYLKKLLQDSCGAKSAQCTFSLQKNCAAGFQSLLKKATKSRLHAPVLAELSPDQKCEMTPMTCFRCDRFYECNFPALVSNSSSWILGTEKDFKFGWVANEKLEMVRESVEPDLAKYLGSSKLPRTDILILLRLSVGIVFLDYLVTYKNIGSATCRLEDLKGRSIGPSYKVDALWPQNASLVGRVRMSASQVPKLPPTEPNAVLRCREHGQKFKIIQITSC